MGVPAPVVPVLVWWPEADRAGSVLRSVTAILENPGLPVNLAAADIACSWSWPIFGCGVLDAGRFNDEQQVVETMRVRLCLKPGQPGTQGLLARYRKSPGLRPLSV